MSTEEAGEWGGFPGLGEKKKRVFGIIFPKQGDN
jgi:hypothetical protein